MNLQKQIGNKLWKCDVKPSSDIMLNDQLSEKFKLIGFEFNISIMFLIIITEKQIK